MSVPPITTEGWFWVVLGIFLILGKSPNKWAMKAKIIKYWILKAFCLNLPLKLAPKFEKIKKWRIVENKKIEKKTKNRYWLGIYRGFRKFHVTKNSQKRHPGLLWSFRNLSRKKNKTPLKKRASTATCSLNILYSKYIYKLKNNKYILINNLNQYNIIFFYKNPW